MLKQRYMQEDCNRSMLSLGLRCLVGTRYKVSQFLYVRSMWSGYDKLALFLVASHKGKFIACVSFGASLNSIF